MDPVLCCLTDEVLLPTSRCAVPLDRVPSGPYIIIKLREFDNESIIIVFKKRLGLQTRRKDRFEVP